MYQRTAMGMHLLSQCENCPDPGWVSAPGATLTRRISSSITPADQLPMGSHALCVGDDGQLLLDQLAHGFGVLGTSFNMVRANALRILAWRYKESLLSILKQPRMQQQLEVTAAVIQLWNEEQQLRREVAESVAADEQKLQREAERDCAADQQGIQQGAERGVDNRERALASASFDTIVAAFSHFNDNQTCIDLEGCTIEEAVSWVHDVLTEVIQGELEAAGMEDAEGVAAEVLAEWMAAYSLRQERNAINAHPLENLEISKQALQLFDKAVNASHPGLLSVSHLARQASAAAHDHVEAMEQRLQLKRTARGKVRVKISQLSRK